MIPVSSLADVEIKWLQIKERGYTIHGFLVYTSADHNIPEYIDGPGLTDLDGWSGRKCGIFLLHEPPADWIEYARTTDHVWWRTYGREDVRISEDQRFIYVDGDRKVSVPELVGILENKGLAKQQAIAVLERFGLDPTENPCMIMFRDLDDNDVWVCSLEELLGKDIAYVRDQMKKFFKGPDFKRLLGTGR